MLSRPSSCDSGAQCRQGATQGHEQRTTPDPAHEGLVVHAHSPRRVRSTFQLLSERNIHITGQPGVDGGFGHGHGAGEVGALFGVQMAQDLSILDQLDITHVCTVVRALAWRMPVSRRV
jgi:hypothetical protein